MLSAEERKALRRRIGGDMVALVEQHAAAYYACGDWRKEETDDPYRPLADAALEAEDALMTAIDRLREAPRAER